MQGLKQKLKIITASDFYCNVFEKQGRKMICEFLRIIGPLPEAINSLSVYVDVNFCTVSLIDIVVPISSEHGPF
jgi:hypothetical protein